MGKYILNRLLWMIFVLVGTAIVIFTIMYFIPKDIAKVLLGSSATQAELASLRERLGLNDPYIVQLLRYLKNVFTKFDLGKSYIYNVPVMQELLSRIPRTFFIGCSVILFDSLLGIPLGLMAGLNQNKWQDALCMVLALIFVSVPNFWLALQLVDIFAVKLHWLPAFGIGGIKYYIMPVFAAFVSGVATNARQMRSSLLDVTRADYITSARAKGVSERNVVLKHMLPNALIPVVTGLGVGLGKSIAGSVIIETVFTIPGVGMYLLTGINNADYPVVQGSIIILSFFSALVMLLLDIVYAQVDPRIKAQYSGRMHGVTK
ncbi:MAG: ABC transporter permease [Lachnospiraceae bacterium]|nr:ABC transporter permease [Lachnospiraceae bacterium]